MYDPNPIKRIPKRDFTSGSGAAFRKYIPIGIPIQVERTRRQAALISTFRHDFKRIVKAIVDAPIATRGVATCKPITIARRGIAINASPNPKADRINVDRKRIDRTSKVVVENSMSQGKENSLVNDELVNPTIRVRF